MFHETIRSFVQAGVLLAAGAFASNLGFLEKIDAQVCFLHAKIFRADNYTNHELQVVVIQLHLTCLCLAAGAQICGIRHIASFGAPTPVSPGCGRCSGADNCVSISGLQRIPGPSWMVRPVTAVEKHSCDVL